MTRPESRGLPMRAAMYSAAAVGGVALLGGLLALGEHHAKDAIAMSEHLHAAAQHDGFKGVTTPAFFEERGVASSTLQLGSCAIRPVTMQYDTITTGGANITSYTLEASAYNADVYSKRLGKYVEEGELRLTFQNSADLHDMLGPDPCTVLEPALATRNLQLS